MEPGDWFRMVQEAAHAAEELGVGKPSLSHPAEVFVVLGRVLTEESEVFRQTPGTGKVVHVEERVWRSHSLIILQSGAHHHWQDLQQQYLHHSDPFALVEVQGVSALISLLGS